MLSILIRIENGWIGALESESRCSRGHASTQAATNGLNGKAFVTFMVVHRYRRISFIPVT